jgi:hypothetical protein
LVNLGCFGAGTPASSRYLPWIAALAAAGEPVPGLDTIRAALASGAGFLSGTANAVLANPEGPLAYLGHLDLTWTYSFQDVGLTRASRSSRFVALLRALAVGRRVGLAMDAVQRALAETNLALTVAYEREAESHALGGAPIDLRQRAHLWLARQDLAGWVLLGDPAARVTPVAAAPVEEAEESVPEVVSGAAIELSTGGSLMDAISARIRAGERVEVEEELRDGAVVRRLIRLG